MVRAFLRIAALLAGLAAVGLAVLPAVASAVPLPYSVSLTQFSKTVSGVAPPGVTAVTVDLLRNTVAANGAVTRNQVDTFTASVNSGTGAWSGSFASHEYSGSNDQAEVNYTPAPNAGGLTPSPQQLTIGGGEFLPSADAQNASNQATAERVDLDPTTLDRDFVVKSDGTTLTGPGTFSASAPGTFTAPTWTFTPAITPSQGFTITEQGAATDGDDTTAVNLTIPGPQMSLAEQKLPTAPAADPAQEQFPIEGLPSCQAYLVLSEVVCSNLTPGSYQLTDGPSSQTITVPAATVLPPQDGDTYQTLFVPREAGATVPGLAGGQTVVLSQNGTVRSTLTVDSLKLNSSQPLGDLQNGSNATTTGSCSPDLFILDDDPDLCTSGGALPSPNNLEDLTTNLTQSDETSLGSTTVFLPRLADQQPWDEEALFTPFVVTALPRYTDPLAQMAADDTMEPDVGNAPIIPSTASNDKAVFSYAPLGSSKFTTLGNANVAGGVQLPPTLAIGWYDGRWTVTDPAGDSYSSDITFYNQGSTSGNVSAPKCSAKVKGGGAHHATIARAKKRKGKSGGATVTFRCTATTGARVALWIQRGSGVVADGSGTVKRGAVTIVMSGSGIKKGTYQLVEVVDLKGHSNETDQTLKLK